MIILRAGWFVRCNHIAVCHCEQSEAIRNTLVIHLIAMGCALAMTDDDSLLNCVKYALPVSHF
jgi:hypothetical protein